MAENDGTRRRIKQIEVMVSETIRETHDTSTVVFFTGNDRLDYKPGHFLMIDPHQFRALDRFTAYLEDQKGRKEPPRAYSLYSAPHEQYLATTVKEETYQSGVTRYPPLLSPLLVNRLPVGTKVVVTGFTGPYTLPDDIESRTDHVVHICAGSGSVPNMSILKYALLHHPTIRHTFLYGNKTWADVIYAKQLRAMRDAHPDTLTVVHALSREQKRDSAELIVHGRVSRELVRTYVPDTDSAEFFVCGPGVTKWDTLRAQEAGTTPSPRFLESTLALLDDLGIKKDRIHSESYG
ncbi:MAG: oxidoreductase [Acidobacteria bacterium]|nr:oxidoreductase [Acidobacteriota bacterium]